MQPGYCAGSSWKHLGTGRRCDPLALCAEMSNPKKEVAWSFLYCNPTASFPGSCIIGNAAKSKLGGRKLEPGSVKLIDLPAFAWYSRPFIICPCSPFLQSQPLPTHTCHCFQPACWHKPMTKLLCTLLASFPVLSHIPC